MDDTKRRTRGTKRTSWDSRAEEAHLGTIPLANNRRRVLGHQQRHRFRPSAARSASRDAALRFMQPTPLPPISMMHACMHRANHAGLASTPNGGEKTTTTFPTESSPPRTHHRLTALVKFNFACITALSEPRPSCSPATIRARCPGSGLNLPPPHLCCCAARNIRSDQDPSPAVLPPCGGAPIWTRHFSISVLFWTFVFLFSVLGWDIHSF